MSAETQDPHKRQRSIDLKKMLGGGGGGGAGADTALLDDDTHPRYDGAAADIEDPADMEGRLKEIQAAIQRFNGEGELPTCYYGISLPRNVIEYVLVVGFAAVGLALGIAGTLTGDPILQWTACAFFTIGAIAGAFITSHKQKMIPRLNDHRRFGELLSFSYQQLLTQQALNQELADEVRKLQKVREDLAAQVSYIQDVNTRTFAMIQQGRKDFTELVKEAREKNTEFWQQFLEFDKVQQELEETSQKLDASQQALTKLAEDLREMLEYPELEEFHQTIRELQPQLAKLREIAEQIRAGNPQSAEEITNFADSVRDALSRIDEQSTAVQTRSTEHKQLLTTCIDQQCRAHGGFLAEVSARNARLRGTAAAAVEAKTAS